MIGGMDEGGMAGMGQIGMVPPLLEHQAGGRGIPERGEFEPFMTFVNTYDEHRTWAVSTMAYDPIQDLLWAGSAEV